MPFRAVCWLFESLLFLGSRKRKGDGLNHHLFFSHYQTLAASAIHFRAPLRTIAVFLLFLIAVNT